VSRPALPAVPGLLSTADLAATVGTIAAEQLPSGMIPWYRGGHADPWNHVEAAMALAVGGRWAEVDRAYEWLLATQRPDGSWHQFHLPDGIEDPKLDANVCAYVATGVWHHWLLRRDRGFVDELWPAVDLALEFVLDLQTPRGEIRWARHVDGTPWPFALLTGSSSILHSLRAGIALAAVVGAERPDWELSAATLAHVVRHVPEAFEPKERWAMDWYYPVLAGGLSCSVGRERLREGWSTFVIDGLGTRCVSDQPWVTGAETCETALAHLVVGDSGRARELLSWAQSLRQEDGSYLTGRTHPAGLSFPHEETSTYTAAAVVLTADALSRTTPAWGALADPSWLPALVEAGDEPQVPLPRE
jgi:hypothetical protein